MLVNVRDVKLEVTCTCNSCFGLACACFSKQQLLEKKELNPDRKNRRRGLELMWSFFPL